MSDNPDQASQAPVHGRNHMDQHSQNDRGSVQYDSRFDEYWVPAGEARQCIFYCPWCGEQLPPAQVDRWFSELEALGIDPWNDEVPDIYRSGAWREQGRSKG